MSEAAREAPPRLRFLVAPEPSHLLRARDRIRDYLILHSCDDELIDDVLVAIEESCTNAILHSGSSDEIEICLGFEGDDLLARVKDQGRGFDVVAFDPEALPDPLCDHGRGLFIMSRLCDDMELRRDGGLEVRLVKRAVARCETPAALESGLADLRAMPQLVHREARLRAQLEEIDEAFFALDWEYRYVYANRAAVRMTATTLEQLRGHTPWELLPALEDSPLRSAYREAMELGKPSVHEHRSLVTGEWFEVRIYPTGAGVSAYYRQIDERKAAEEELGHYRLLAQQARDIMLFVRHADGRILEANAAAEKAYGYSKKELLARSIYDLRTEATSPAVHGQMAAASGPGILFETRHRRADGSVFPVEVSSQGTTAMNGEMVLLSIVRDISERKQAEDSRRESDEHFRSLFENMLDGYAYCRMLYEDGAPSDFVYLEVNSVFERLTGLKDVVGRKVSAIIPGIQKDNPELLEIYGRVAQGGQPESFETYLEALGTWFSVSVYSPRAEHFVAVFENITERKRAEAALRESEERFRSLFESTTEGVALHEVVYRDGRAVDYRVLDVNPSFEQQTGLAAERARGQLASVLYGTGVAPYLADYARVAETGEPYAFEAYFQPMGRHFRITAVSPGPGRFATVFSDITERKRGDEENQRLLEDSQTLAEELQVQSEELHVQTEDLAERFDLAEALNTINRLVHATVDFDEIMQHALDEGVRALTADAGTIEMREESCWVVRYQRGLAVADVGLRQTDDEAPYATRAARRGEPFVTADALGDAGVDTGFVRARGLRSVLAMPLFGHETVIGCLLFYGRSVRVFDDSEIDFARKLGATVALAIENARLYEEIALRERLNTALNDINTLIHSTLRVEEIMQRIVASAVDAVGSDSAMIALRHGDDWVAEYGHPEVPGVIHESVRSDEAPFMMTAVTERRPIAIDDCESDPRCILEVQRRFGVRSVLCVPLIAKDEVLGVIFFNRHRTAAKFDSQTVDFAAKLAAAISSALENARLYEEQLRIATTLQENFVHPLPSIAGLELGVVSQPASAPELVGGDFSDVFLLADGQVAILIGDVAGKGVRAAGLTETVRSNVRAFATIDSAPAFVLRKTNEALLRYEPDESHVTAFFAVLDAGTGHLSFGSAGHPAPIHLGPFSCLPLDVAFGPPLGTFRRDYTTAHVMLTLEDYLVLYTDGVTEARCDGELFGEERLLAAVAGLRGRSAQGLAEGVRDAALAFAVNLRDDLQVVALRLG